MDQDTELQMIVVGAGRADLVAQRGAWETVNNWQPCLIMGYHEFVTGSAPLPDLN